MLGLSSVQIGASAMAAVTSALAASFFGVAGTLIGAAVGSVISTIAGAMYAESMRRAADRLRDAQTVVIQHVPFGTAQHPAQVPSREALTQVVSAAAAPDVPLPSEAVPGTEVPGAALLNPSDQDTADDGSGGIEDPRGPRPWWRRPVFALPVVGVAGFLIAIGIITGIEGLTGHPLSGGSGTSLSRIGGSSSAPPAPVTPASTVTVPATTPAASASAATVTASPTATATRAPVVPSAEPSATSSAAPDATTTAPDVTPSTGSSVASTSGVDTVSTGAPAN